MLGKHILDNTYVTRDPRGHSHYMPIKTDRKLGVVTMKFATANYKWTIRMMHTDCLMQTF